MGRLFVLIDVRVNIYIQTLAVKRYKVLLLNEFSNDQNFTAEYTRNIIIYYIINVNVKCFRPIKNYRLNFNIDVNVDSFIYHRSCYFSQDESSDVSQYCATILKLLLDG